MMIAREEKPEKLYLKCRIVRRYFGLPLQAPDNDEVVSEHATIEFARSAYERFPAREHGPGHHLVVQYATEAADGSVYEWYDTNRSTTPMVNADIEARRWCEQQES